MMETIKPTLVAHFKPALLARMTMVPYLPISPEALGEITRLKLDAVIHRLRNNQRIEGSYSDEMVKHIGWVVVGLLACGPLTANAAEDKGKVKEVKVEYAPGKTAILKYEDLKEGDGDEAKKGTKVTVHYTGWLTDNTKFDSSKDRNRPFTFALGAGMVIKGWDEGVQGMKVGGVRKLIIPYQLAYGEAGRPPVIPARAELTFEVELLKINP